MIYIPILIIIIILCVDLYLTFSIRFNKTNDEKFDNEEKTKEQDEIIFDNPNPWNKIQYFTHINKYYIKINKLSEHIEKIMVWKSLPIIRNDLIDIDIDNNYLILKTHSEEEALVICNLILNYINNNLTINDIVSKNLINYSINKAKRYKLIGTKLTELIKDGIKELNDKDTFDVNDDNNDDDDDDNEKNKKDLINKIKMIDNNDGEKFNNNTIKEIKPTLFDRIEPYEGSEYATINF